eukprot:CAMPEP_0119070236 /NCGR_PEP_ID=MMETSP1178-20130426/37810_1 /TAXON_ID=33656 /ORGANISM="unid sp, Strain CCMP2000" /LENGTH=166 /DNA_ID=CAMNT_0007052051 /DNA_START=197 /DNA_END=695 /DNA_ORIENTATION=-
MAEDRRRNELMLESRWMRTRLLIRVLSSYAEATRTPDADDNAADKPDGSTHTLAVVLAPVARPPYTRHEVNPHAAKCAATTATSSMQQTLRLHDVQLEMQRCLHGGTAKTVTKTASATASKISAATRVGGHVSKSAEGKVPMPIVAVRRDRRLRKPVYTDGTRRYR